MDIDRVTGAEWLTVNQPINGTLITVMGTTGVYSLVSQRGIPIGRVYLDELGLTEQVEINKSRWPKTLSVSLELITGHQDADTTQPTEDTPPKI